MKKMFIPKHKGDFVQTPLGLLNKSKSIHINRFSKRFLIIFKEIT